MMKSLMLILPLGIIRSDNRLNNALKREDVQIFVSYLDDPDGGKIFQRVMHTCPLENFEASEAMGDTTLLKIYIEEGDMMQVDGLRDIMRKEIQEFNKEFNVKGLSVGISFPRDDIQYMDYVLREAGSGERLGRYEHRILLKAVRSITDPNLAELITHIELAGPQKTAIDEAVERISRSYGSNYREFKSADASARELSLSQGVSTHRI